MAAENEFCQTSWVCRRRIARTQAQLFPTRPLTPRLPASLRRSLARQPIGPPPPPPRHPPPPPRLAAPCAGAAADRLALRPRELAGPAGPEPTRFGDWEKNGR